MRVSTHIAAAFVAIATCTGGCAPLPVPRLGPIGRTGDTVCLNADGPAGRDSYEIVESVLGVGAIESPDQDHDVPVRHLAEAVDSEVGAHFVFALHRQPDKDRANTDRQRMEIKVFDRSEDALKAKEGSTFTYSWRFRIDPELPVSRRFTHLFQLKPVRGDDRMPLVTITGAKRDDGDRLEVRYMLGGGSAVEVLAETDWARNRGVWLEAICRVTYAHAGTIELVVRRPDGETVLEVSRAPLDLWLPTEFVRPKWGIYRGLSDAGNLAEAEARVAFANLAITRGPSPSSNCH